MKKQMSLSFLFSCLIVTPVFAATQTLTTYYPAPSGNYQNITVNNGQTYGATNNVIGGQSPTYTCPGQDSNVSVYNLTINGQGTLGVCEGGTASQPNSGTWTAVTANALWVSQGNGAGGNYLSQANQAENVGIGSWSADPGYSLGVNGPEYINGLSTITGGATLGVQGDSTTTTINSGTAVVNSGSLTINSSNVGIGTTGGATAVITMTGNVTVSGSTTLNNGATVTNQDLVVNGSNVDVTNGGTLNLATGGSTTPATIQFCTNPQNPTAATCGTLMVAQGSDGNYYAAYGP